MEIQQTPETFTPLDNYFNISFDAATRAQIRQAANWAKVYAICAFAGYAIALVVAFFGRMTYLSDSNPGALQFSATFRNARILSALITTAVGVFINYFLYRFAVATVKGIDAMDSVTTNEGFNHLRRYFRILGILIIIGLCFVVLGFIFGILAGLSHS
ncbi:MAG TPA: hypothetical protein VNU70_03350 [Puia sp.]|jgi:hypothetical protein|nr:hypothetical protein [Puia sp.]